MGFSLVELLVVIAVIGLIAVIAIPQVTGIVDRASRGSAQRNAQTIAQVASAAQAAGNTTIELAADLDAAVTLVSNATTGEGAFYDMEFTLSDLAPEDITAAKAYLTFTNGTIHYAP